VQGPPAPTAAATEGAALPPYGILQGDGMAVLYTNPAEDSGTLGSYYPGVPVVIDARYDAQWLKVRIGVTSGYLRAERVSLEGISGRALTTYAASVPTATLKNSPGDSHVTLRAAPNELSDVVDTCRAGATARILGIAGVWQHVAVDGKIGYVRAENVQ